MSILFPFRKYFGIENDGLLVNAGPVSLTVDNKVALSAIWLPVHGFNVIDGFLLSMTTKLRSS